jgi:hypothetical protein
MRIVAIWALLLFAFGCLVAIAIPVHAHWASAPGVNPDPKIAAWYSAQHNAHGDWCCDKADGHDFFDAYTIDLDGSVEFNAGGAHIHLPAFMVLRGPNPTGHAVWWYVITDAGSRVDYCFAVGPGA